MKCATPGTYIRTILYDKTVGKGTGLGLATVYGIVQQNKGTVWVYSEINKGTEFKVYLPRTDQLISKKSVHKEAPSKALTGKVILVVEDQEPLRRAICNSLKKAGYTVHEAGNGAIALEFLKQANVRVDLVVTDVVMPEMGGQELANRLRTAGISPKMLFLSGYTEDVLDDHGVSDTTSEFLEKPFSNSDLLDRVRNLLS